MKEKNQKLNKHCQRWEKARNEVVGKRGRKKWKRDTFGESLGGLANKLLAPEKERMDVEGGKFKKRYKKQGTLRTEKERCNRKKTGALAQRMKSPFCASQSDHGF